MHTELFIGIFGTNCCTLYLNKYGNYKNDLKEKVFCLPKNTEEKTGKK